MPMTNACMSILSRGMAVLCMSAVVGMVRADDVPIGAKPTGWVERALFTASVENREPGEPVVLLDEVPQDVYFYTELRQLAGHTITHRWEYAGEVVAEVPFEVGGPRWRVYSKKRLLPTQAGKWSVVVVDESGWVLHAEMFEYHPPARQGSAVGTATTGQ